MHHRPSRKVIPASTQQRSIQEKNGGNLACTSRKGGNTDGLKDVPGWSEDGHCTAS